MTQGYYKKGIYFPHPSEVKAAKERMSRLAELTFKVGLPDGVREVIMQNWKPILKVPKRPKLTVISFTLAPMIITPTAHTIPGIFFITEAGFAKHQATWQRDADPALVQRDGALGYLRSGEKVMFGASTEAAAIWFLRKLARAQGKHFRSHGILTPGGGSFRYTVTP